MLDSLAWLMNKLALTSLLQHILAYSNSLESLYHPYHLYHMYHCIICYDVFLCGSSRHPSLPKAEVSLPKAEVSIPSCPAGRQISRGARQVSAQHIVSEAVQLDGSVARWC